MTPESALTFTAEEQKVLVDLLQEALKSSRLEEHRTDAISYRQHVMRRQELLESMLRKLETPVH
jgi:hypothetical protein